ncbi:MAG: DUF3857 domain-containing protein [Candidatus Omnitrophota bacterium]
MTIKKYSILLVMIGWLMTAPALWAGPMEDAWSDLFANRFEAAQKVFASAVDSASGEEALRGLLFCAWAQGEAPGMAAILSHLIVTYPKSPYLDAYLSFGGFSTLQGWTPAERVKALDQALSQSPPDPQRQWLAYELAESLDMLADLRSGEAARQAGVLVDDWNIVGPFGRYGMADFKKPFGPETGWKEKYSGWRGEVAIHPIKPADITGLLDIDSLIYPSEGVAYALNAIESGAAQDAVMTVHSPSDFRVWWNGEPILEKSSARLDTSRAVSFPITLKKGKNLLAIKSRQSGPWWLRAKIQANGRTPLSIHSIPFDVKDFAELSLIPFEIKKSDSVEFQGIASPSLPFALDADHSAKEAAERLLLAAWHLDRMEFDAVNENLRKAMEISPDFCVLHEMLGEAGLRHANSRPGSKPRFHQEAEASLRRALELYPGSKDALVGLLTYFMDRDQTDQALDLIDKVKNEHPEFFGEGYTAMLDYSYGGLYAKKNFIPDSARYYERSLQGFLPSYEVFRHLFHYYGSNNSLERVVDIIVRALQVFPAYSPILERAVKFPEKLAGKIDLGGLFQRLMEIHPYEANYGLFYGDFLESQGKLDEAVKLYAQLRQRFPHNTRIMDNQAALAYLTQGKDTAEEIYRQWRQQEPNNMKPFRFFRDVKDKGDFDYMKYDVPLDDVDIDEADKWESSRASVIYLLDIMVMQLHEDGTYDQYIHQAIKILNQEGMQKWAEVVIPKGQHIEIIMGRTIAPDGTEWAVSNVQDLSGQQSLSMYGVDKGAIVEYAYLERTGRREPGANYSAGGYFFGSDDDPMLLSKLTLIQPDGVPLNLDSNPDDFHANIIKEEGRTIYQWENRLQDGLKPERFGPTLSERVPALQWTTCPDWLAFVERLRSSLEGFEEASPEVDRLVKELKTEAKTPREYAEKVYDWIRLNIEESGGGQTTADTVALKAGGRYQKMKLAMHLLRKENIHSQLVLALENDEHDGFRPLPFLNFPGQTMLVIPRQDGIDRQLASDFSSRFAPLNDIDPKVQKFVILVYDANIPYFEPLESKLWESGLIRREARLKINADRSAAVQGEFAYDVIYDRQIREALTNPEIKKRLADSQITRDLPGIQIGQYSIEDLDDLSLAPRLVFSGVMPDGIKSADGNALKISPVLSRANASGLVSEPTRETPIVFTTSPVRDPLILRFDVSAFLEQGAQFQLPENVLLLTEYGYYSLFYEWEGSEIVVRRSFLIPPQKIEPSIYQGFVEFCRSIDQAEDRDIRILMTPTNK